MKLKLRNVQSVALIFSTLLVSQGHVAAQNLINGSFELGVNPGSDFIDLSAVNSTTITGWTVSSGTLDYIGGRWVPADGSRCIDLNGSTAGTLTQSVSGFSTGQSYQLYFFMAANPEGAPTSKSLQASIGSASQTFTASNAGFTPSNLGWTQRMLPFTATGTTLTLTFTSLISGDYGPTIDEVSIVAVPEPGTLSLGITALAFGLFIRRK